MQERLIIVRAPYGRDAQIHLLGDPHAHAEGARAFARAVFKIHGDVAQRFRRQPKACQGGMQRRDQAIAREVLVVVCRAPEKDDVVLSSLPAARPSASCDHRPNSGS